MLWLDKIYAIYKIKYSLIFWHGCKTLLIAQYKKKKRSRHDKKINMCW